MSARRWCGTGVLVANPAAGQRDPDLIDAVATHCASFVTDLSVVRTGYPGHAEEIAAKALARDVDVLVALGGDGTVREVAAGMAQAEGRDGASTVAMLHLPGGTGNSFYREIWGERPWRQAVAAALGAPRPLVRRVDMARVRETGALVLLGACSGLVAEALVTARSIPDVHGRDRYQEAVAMTLRGFVPHPGRVTVDGRVVHEGSVVLANVGGGRYRGGRFMLLPRSVLDDGLLDVCVVSGDLDPTALPGLTRDGGHLDRPEVVYERGRQVVVERTDGRPLTFEYDGELPAEPAYRYTVDVLPNVVAVLAPPGGADDRKTPSST